MPSSESRKLVLDTSAILAGILSGISGEEVYVTPLVIAESKRKARDRVELLLDFGKVKVLEPDLASVKRVIDLAEAMGETAHLSPADVSILALASQISQGGPVDIATDDYSIQNLANRLGVGFSSMGTKGIKTAIEWEYFCKGCHRRFSKANRGAVCPYCGSDIARKPADKKPLGR